MTTGVKPELEGVNISDSELFPHSNNLVFYHNINPPPNQAVLLNVSEGRKELWAKTKAVTISP